MAMFQIILLGGMATVSAFIAGTSSDISALLKPNDGRERLFSTFALFCLGIQYIIVRHKIG
jgi:hypothetical protein